MSGSPAPSGRRPSAFDLGDPARILEALANRRRGDEDFHCSDPALVVLERQQLLRDDGVNRLSKPQPADLPLLGGQGGDEPFDRGDHVRRGAWWR